MPFTTETNKTKIDALRHAKIVNEFAMSRAICDAFDSTPELSTDSNKIALHALEVMLSLNTILLNDNTNKTNKYARLLPIAKAYIDERNLKMMAEGKDRFNTLDSTLKDSATDRNAARAVFLQAFNIAGGILQKLQKTASDYLNKVSGAVPLPTKTVGEIVRLFGGLCEQVYPDPARDPDPKDLLGNSTNKALGLGLSVVKVSKDQSGKEVSTTLVADLGDFCGLRIAYRTTDYGAAAFAPDARTRRPRKPPTMENALLSEVGLGVKIGNALFRGVEPNWTDDSYKTVVSGNTLFELLPGDVVRAIDRVLGLSEGASISGTTSDNLWAIEVLMGAVFGNNASAQNPNLYLLPLAAIVSGYHHTVLEVGLSLTINHYDILRYAPGFYTSLQPEAWRKCPGGDKLYKVLLAAENSPDNALMYVTTEGTQLTASIVNKTVKTDVDAFRLAVTMTFENYTRWKTLALPARPDQQRPDTFSKANLTPIARIG